jgi:glyoxylase-like metal-dependent hydrolase (beta-lactamase superfamily II)
LITTAGQEEFEWYSAHSEQRLGALEDQFQNARETDRKDLSLLICYFQGLVEQLPETEVHLPEITVNDRFEIHGTHYSAELTSFEGGHTGSDTVLYLPEAGILFTSDLVFIDCHPYLADGNPAKLLTALKSLRQMDADHIVPGHGPVGTRTDLDIMSEYVELCIETAKDLVKTGDVDSARIQEMPPTGRFSDWQFPHFYHANLQFLCKEFTNG